MTSYFFLQWCPPCKALLPELRKASVLVSDVKFATVDCVSFSEFCENVRSFVKISTSKDHIHQFLFQFGIESYPSTYLFNGSSLTPFNGHHHHQAIRTFIQVLHATYNYIVIISYFRIKSIRLTSN